MKIICVCEEKLKLSKLYVSTLYERERLIEKFIKNLERRERWEGGGLREQRKLKIVNIENILDILLKISP